MELYEHERVKNIQSRTVLENKIRQPKAEMCDDVNEETDRIMMSEMEYIDQAEFVGIRTELVGIFNSYNFDKENEIYRDRKFKTF